MSEIAILAHTADPDIRWLASVLDEHRQDWTLVRTCQGDQLPDLGALRGVICIGGPQSANGPEPYLLSEQRFLHAAVAGEIPVMGICLGSQLLAQALGGTVRPCPQGPEIGYIKVTVTGSDPTLTAGQRAYLSYHGDTFDVPPGADLLATSLRFPQAYRLGTALGIQFHPEMSPKGVRALATREPERIRATGIEPADLVAESEWRAPTAFRHLNELVSGWLYGEVFLGDGAGTRNTGKPE